ncbi:histidine kinase [Dictyobacter alpinus]|uniref:histidine kinase n=1 Tax=Dictyobacter alpinus TaxID=2014873 RepID=A0A402BFJ8_9CHLR|nr:ATP-binding protein [Dictyobacter alpinus]GCE30154.1 histidine kinase [Dictyobacter alpinus]
MKPLNIRQPLSESERFAALSRIGAALMSERNEEQLLQYIAQTAADLIGAEFAAFTLRPINEHGELLVPAEGHLFHLAAVIGATKEQETLFRQVPLGGEGLLAPIFRHGVPVLVADIQKMTLADAPHTKDALCAAREAASAFAHGHLSSEGLRSVGLPTGHPILRSFLGAPLLDSERQVRGGLLLGHSKPDQFQKEHEEILMGLAAQAAVAIENARLYNVMHTRAQELNAIFESIGDGVTLVDSQGHIIRENYWAKTLREQLEQYPQGKQALEALLHGPARSACQGISEHDVLVKITNEKQEVHEYIVNASPLRQQATQNRATHINIAGGYYTHEVTSGSVIIWHDVTEVRRLLRERQAYAEAEARRVLLQHILDELPSSVYLVHGKDARLVLANRASSKVWGVTWEHEVPMVEFLHRNHIEIFQVDGRPFPLDQLATLQAVQQGETAYQRQEIIRHADGSTLPVLVNAIALDSRNFPLNLPDLPRGTHELVALVVHQDVSALKEAEALKDEFIGIAAHELRNPLAVLQGFVQLLQAQLTRDKNLVLTDLQHESLEGIEQGTQRLTALTDDLLDVTRLQAGRLELRHEVMDIIPLIKRLVNHYQMTTTQHHLQVIAPETFLLVSIDARRIEQAINNLLSNAIKYSPQGGPIEIHIQEDRQQNKVIVGIKDTGIGIPAQQQARIFGRFMRADNAQAHGIQGTGLGLYLCRELIERQGGSIWFHSVENQGSIFFFSLPLVEVSSDETFEDMVAQNPHEYIP